MVEPNVLPAAGPIRLNLCRGCRERKPLEQFGPSRRPRAAVDQYCVACRSESDRLGGRNRTVDAPCVRCGSEVVRDGKGHRRCPACRAAGRNVGTTTEHRRRWRASVAKRAGKSYTPGVEFWRVSAAARRGKGHRLPDDWHENAWRVIEERNARDAWRWWLAAAPSWWKRARHAALYGDKPWAAPGLTNTQRFRLRYRNDPEFHLAQRLRLVARKGRVGYLGDRLRQALKSNQPAKPICDFLGYSIADLRRHLERQFARDMTWEKFCTGAIHIDHVVPLVLFDLDDPEEVRRAWALTNLQPLWGTRNLTKGAKRETLL